MKKTKVVVLLLVVLGLTALCWPRKSLEDVAVSRAVPLGMDLPMIVLGGEEEWLELVVPRFGHVQFHVSETREPVYFELFDVEREHRLYVAEEVRAKSMREVRAVAPDEYRVRVTTENETVAFQVRLTVVPEQDCMEPNDEPENAVQVFGSFQARAFPEADVDWYRVDVGEPSTLRIVYGSASQSVAPYQVSVQLQGEIAPRPLEERKGLADVGEHPRNRVVALNLPTGSHLFRFESTRASEALHEIEFDLSRADDVYEPNDERESASVVEPNSELTLTLTPGDRDWYSTEIPAPGFLSFGTNSRVAAAQPQIVLHTDEESEGQALTWLNKVDYTKTVEVDPGKVEFCVQGARELGLPLQLQVRFTPRAVAQDTNLFVIGLETEVETNRQIAAIAAAGGGTLLTTNKVSELPDIIERVIEEVQAPTLVETRASPLMWWIGLSLVIAIGAGCYTRRKRINNAEAQPATSSGSAISGSAVS